MTVFGSEISDYRHPCKTLLFQISPSWDLRIWSLVQLHLVLTGDGKECWLVARWQSVHGQRYMTPRNLQGQHQFHRGKLATALMELHTLQSGFFSDFLLRQRSEASALCFLLRTQGSQHFGNSLLALVGILQIYPGC